jgi:hypothetical protein
VCLTRTGKAGLFALGKWLQQEPSSRGHGTSKEGPVRSFPPSLPEREVNARSQPDIGTLEMVPAQQPLSLISEMGRFDLWFDSRLHQPHHRTSYCTPLRRLLHCTPYLPTFRAYHTSMSGLVWDKPGEGGSGRSHPDRSPPGFTGLVGMHMCGRVDVWTLELQSGPNVFFFPFFHPTCKQVNVWNMHGVTVTDGEQAKH